MAGAGEANHRWLPFRAVPDRENSQRQKNGTTNPHGDVADAPTASEDDTREDTSDGHCHRLMKCEQPRTHVVRPQLSSSSSRALPSFAAGL